jgi:hypothetical protein
MEIPSASARAFSPSCSLSVSRSVMAITAWYQFDTVPAQATEKQHGVRDYRALGLGRYRVPCRDVVGLWWLRGSRRMLKMEVSGDA